MDHCFITVLSYSTSVCSNISSQLPISTVYHLCFVYNSVNCTDTNRNALLTKFKWKMHQIKVHLIFYVRKTAKLRCSKNTVFYSSKIGLARRCWTTPQPSPYPIHIHRTLTRPLLCRIVVRVRHCLSRLTMSRVKSTSASTKLRCSAMLASRGSSPLIVVRLRAMILARMAAILAIGIACERDEL